MTTKTTTAGERFYKAVRPDGTDFHTGTVRWAPVTGPVEGWIITHPTSTSIGSDASTYLSVSTVAADCTGAGFPCRLLLVEAVGPVTAPRSSLPNKRGGLTFRVVEELDSVLSLGPNRDAVAAFLAQLGGLTAAQWDAACDAARAASWGAASAAACDAARDAACAAARDAARAAACDAACAAARDAAWDAACAAARGAAGDAAGDAAWDAAVALVVRDLITVEQFETLVAPMRAAGITFAEQS